MLPQARAIQRQDLFLQYLNALAALQRWSEIKDLLMSEHSAVDPMVQHMYLAVAQAHLGSATGATNEWQRALEVANTPEKLLTLANTPSKTLPTISPMPRIPKRSRSRRTNRAAYAGRLRLALAAGKTAQAQTIAAEIAQLWPDDAAARNQDAYLRLLLGASGDAAEAAERDAQVLVAKGAAELASPGNARPGAVFVWARNKEALAAIRGSAGNRRRAARRARSARSNSGGKRL